MPAKKVLSVRSVYVVVCINMYKFCLFWCLSLRARSGVAELVFAFQCMIRGHESCWDTSLNF